MGPLVVRLGFIPNARTDFLEPIPYGWTPCSTAIQGGGLVLLQFAITNFLDFPWEALPFQKSGLGFGLGEG